jgi:hypothetical protein
MYPIKRFVSIIAFAFPLDSAASVLRLSMQICVATVLYVTQLQRGGCVTQPESCTCTCTSKPTFIVVQHVHSILQTRTRQNNGNMRRKVPVHVHVLYRQVSTPTYTQHEPSKGSTVEDGLGDLEPEVPYIGNNRVSSTKHHAGGDILYRDVHDQFSDSSMGATDEAVALALPAPARAARAAALRVPVKDPSIWAPEAAPAVVVTVRTAEEEARPPVVRAPAAVVVVAVALPEPDPNPAPDPAAPAVAAAVTSTVAEEAPPRRVRARPEPKPDPEVAAGERTSKGSQ